MPYEFNEDPPEPQTQTAIGRNRKPPGTLVAVSDFVPPEPHSSGPNLGKAWSLMPWWLQVLLIVGILGVSIAVVVFLSR